ncbi:Gfo/Idh/MocA family protein [Pseudactinotalea sp. Z1748]|uniref:Gfo/Idh/MocA family protein n=1 Tax=Pseudactinotalea sp. Z1748 TaxID=3413027 RepID=UPI003C7E9983
MSKAITAVVISAGAWSRTSHLPALRADSGVDIAMVTSQNPDRARELAEEFAVPRWSSDWHDALEQAPSIAVVSSPPVAHEEQVLAALNAGSHVLVEKPFALNSGSARRMNATAQAAHRSLLVGFGWVAAPTFQLARSLVATGEIGKIELVDCHLDVNTRALLSGGTDGGWGAADASEPRTYTDAAISGGGAVAVSMSHQLGLVHWITGERFTSVDAHTFPPGADIDLHASTNFGLEHGGSASLSCASTHPYLARPQWLLRIYGSKAQLTVDSVSDAARMVDASGRVTEFTPEQASGVYDPGAPTKALVDAARGRDAHSGMSGPLAVHVVEASDAIYQSARTGRRVAVPTEGAHG